MNFYFEHNFICKIKHSDNTASQTFFFLQKVERKCIHTFNFEFIHSNLVWAAWKSLHPVDDVFVTKFKINAPLKIYKPRASRDIGEPWTQACRVSSSHSVIGGSLPTYFFALPVYQLLAYPMPGLSWLWHVVSVKQHILILESDNDDITLKGLMQLERSQENTKKTPQKTTKKTTTEYKHITCLIYSIIYCFICMQRYPLRKLCPKAKLTYWLCAWLQVFISSFLNIMLHDLWERHSDQVKACSSQPC